MLPGATRPVLSRKHAVLQSAADHRLPLQLIHSALEQLLALHLKTAAPAGAQVVRDVSQLAKHISTRKEGDAAAQSTAGTNNAAELHASCIAAYAQLLRRLHKAAKLPLSAAAASQLVQQLSNWRNSVATEPVSSIAGQECLRTALVLATAHFVSLDGSVQGGLVAAAQHALRESVSVSLPCACVASRQALLDAAESFLTEHAAAMNHEQLATLLSASIEALHSHASLRSGPITDDWHAKQYSALLRSTAHCVAASDASVAAQRTAVLVDTLSRFWVYGNSTRPARTASIASAAGSVASHSAESAGEQAPKPGKYVPPSRRRHTGSDSSSTAVDTSDSDASAASGGGGGEAARVRVCALDTLTAVLKRDASALHPLWDRLLPHAAPLQAGSKSSSLPAVLLHDTSSAARVAAAHALQLMLTHPRAAAFMAVAAFAQKRAQRVRAFMPLSESLAEMLVATHSALAASLQQERVAEVQLEVLRSAKALLAHSPYARLPAGTLDTLVRAALPLWQPAALKQVSQMKCCGLVAMLLPACLFFVGAECWRVRCCCKEHAAQHPRTESTGVLAATEACDKCAVLQAWTPRHQQDVQSCAVLSLLTSAFGSQQHSQTPLNISALGVQQQYAEVQAASPGSTSWCAPEQQGSAKTLHTIGIVEALLGAAAGKSAPVQMDALHALRSLCQHHFAAVEPHWPALNNLVCSAVHGVREPGVGSSANNVAKRSSNGTSGWPTSRRASQSGEGSSASAAERTAMQALRLAGDFVQQAVKGATLCAFAAYTVNALEACDLGQIEHASCVGVAVLMANSCSMCLQMTAKAVKMPDPRQATAQRSWHKSC